MEQVLFVECGFGADQHGQDATKAAVRACRNAIGEPKEDHTYACAPSRSTNPRFPNPQPAEFNSIPSIKKLVPGGYDGMKLRVQLAVPDKYSKGLDLEAVRKVFPYGKMLPIEVGGVAGWARIGV